MSRYRLLPTPAQEQCRQLTQARAEHPWLAAGSQTVQQQALRDFAAAMAAFFDPGNPAGRPDTPATLTSTRPSTSRRGTP